MPYAIDLSGHRALVTGAGQGVGRGIAMTLGEAGAEVLVNDLVLERAQSVVSEIELAGGKGRPAVFDVTDYDAVRAAVAEGGPVDVLVNNAGNAGRASDHGLRGPRPARADRARRLGAVHQGEPVRRDVRGPRRVAGDDRSGLGPHRDRHLRHRGVGETNMAAYSAAKAGAAGFCRSIAREVGRHGITVNCVALGTMNTQGIPPEEDEVGERLVKRYVVRRRGLPRDIAHMVVSLAAPDADWVTGQTIPVNGGYSFNL